MIKSLKNKVWNSLNKIGLGGSVQLHMAGMLKENGWFRSYHTKRSVDAAGNPLPWYTYPFIHFISSRIKPHFEAFEYGSGNSTKWYAARIKDITAVEHVEEWVEIVRPDLPANAEVLHRELGKEYIEAIAEKGKKYHLVIVDGRERVKCAIFAFNYLTPDGVLILDNSEREFYNEAKEHLQRQGFRQIDFYGMAPIVSLETCTSVFYRPDNCLDI